MDMKYSILSGFLILTASFNLSASQVGFSFDSDGVPDSPASISALPGETITAELVGDFSDTSLIGGGIQLNFNPSVLTLNRIPEINSTWNFASSIQPSTIDEINSGTLDLVFNTFPSVSPGVYSIASFEFLVSGSPGTESALNLESMNLYSL
jgi:hypothetical protein